MAKLNKWECADLWAQIKSLRTVDLKALADKIKDEETARAAKVKRGPRRPKPAEDPPTETDAVVRKMRLRKGEGTAAGETTAQG